MRCNFNFERKIYLMTTECLGKFSLDAQGGCKIIQNLWKDYLHKKFFIQKLKILKKMPFSREKISNPIFIALSSIRAVTVYTDLRTNRRGKKLTDLLYVVSARLSHLWSGAFSPSYRQVPYRRWGWLASFSGSLELVGPGCMGDKGRSWTVHSARRLSYCSTLGRGA